MTQEQQEMTIFPCQGDVPVGIQPCWIQEQQTKTKMTKETFDFTTTLEGSLLWDCPHLCHTWLRSSPILSNVHPVGPQKQYKDTVKTAATSPAVLSKVHSNLKISSTTIHTCDCSCTTLQEFLLSSSLDDLSSINEIHIQGIHKTKSPAAVTTPSSPSSISASVITLLQLQHLRPKRLTLRDCNLQVSELFDIMKVLRQMHCHTLEYLDLRHNGFAPRVLQWILSIHLGSLQSLKEIYLRQGIRCMVHQNVRDAIMEGLDKNRHHTLHYIDLFHWDKSIVHILDVNRAGRRVFQLESFPLGLWPFLLERAAKKEILAKEPGHRTQRLVARQAGILYYMLRNGPLLLQK
jgi:hypothetical protein